MIFLALVAFSYAANAATVGGIYVPDNTNMASSDIKTILNNVLTWILGIIGFIAVIAFVVSGIQYLTAAGNENQMESAKRNLLYSIIGVVVASAGIVIIKTINYLLGGN